MEALRMSVALVLLLVATGSGEVLDQNGVTRFGRPLRSRPDGKKPIEVTLASDGSVASVDGSVARGGVWKSLVDALATSMSKNPGAPVRQRVNGSTPVGTVKVGTPPVDVKMIFDTGSNQFVLKTWDSVMRQMRTVDGNIGMIAQPTANIYSHNKSNSWARLYVNANATSNKSNATHPKFGYIVYGSGYAITDQGNETIKAGDYDLVKFPISEIMADSLQMLHTKKGIAGVLGLQHMKNRSFGISLFSRLRDDNKCTAFGYCRDQGNVSSGTFIWGDTATEGTALNVVGQMHWALSLADVEVKANAPTTSQTAASGATSAVLAGEISEDDGFVVPESESGIKREICPQAGCVAIIDTGSNIIAGPKEAIALIMKDIGAKSDCSNLHQLPTLNLKLGGMNITLPPSAYMTKINLPPWLRKVIPFHHHASFGGVGGVSRRRGFASFASLGSRRTFWHRAVKEIEKRHGFDLSATLLEGRVPPFSTLTGGQMCMPAFVSLNSKTAMGPLWVYGTPLFDRYYARWSWSHGDTTPKIFLKDVTNASVCQASASGASLSASMVEPRENGPLHMGPVLMRAESTSARAPASTMVALEQGTASPNQAGAFSDPNQQQSFALREIELEDIAFPHWARGLETV